MSGGEKTEKPTPKRLEDARKQGQVAKSNDLNGAIVLTAAALMVGMAGPYCYEMIYTFTHHALGNMLTQSITYDGFITVISSTTQSILLLIAPLFAVVTAMAILGNLVQIKPLFAIQAIQPKFDKINPLNGFKRMFSMRSIIETVKALLKMAIIAFAGTSVITAHQSELLGLHHASLTQAVAIVLDVIGGITAWACSIFLVLGLIDYFYQRFELEKQLRMSKQDIEDERKNQDGDPQIKRRIREIGIQMSRKRQLADVKTADVIITNPTHYSVAIKYDPDISPAPMVVAKGVDHFALKIREVAGENKVPIIENKPVARTLYALVEVGHMIPPELFVAVAEVLALVFSKNKGRRSQGQSRVRS